MGTHEFTVDLEMLREALQEDQLTFVMYSYGTQVGALFADRFPTAVRAMVLDSAMNLNLVGEDVIVESVMAREEVFNNFLEQCSLTLACPFFGDGDPAGAWDAMVEDLQRLESEQAQGDLGLTRALRQLGNLSRDQANWGMLAQILVELQEQDLEQASRIISVLMPPDLPPDIDPTAEDPLDDQTEAMQFTAVVGTTWFVPPEFRSSETSPHTRLLVRG